MYRFSLFFLAFVLFLGLIFSQPLEAFGPSFTDKEIDILFTGDMMLGRGVEGLALENGWDYSFRGLSFLAEPDITVANFEGVVPDKHVKTPKMGFKFSFRKEIVLEMIRSGVDVVSLANNHSDNFGLSGLEQTQKFLAGRGVDYFGHPHHEYGQVHTYPSDVGNIHFIGFNETFKNLNSGRANQVINLFNREDDFVIVSIHWGDEYEELSNTTQQTLARGFIDSGADLVIGHHPHVVQEVEIYKGKPIFYSLGNFIFDQYWTEKVEEGLAVSLIVKEDRVDYEVVPVNGNHSQTRVLEGLEKTSALKELAEKSTISRYSSILSGGFSVSR